MRVLSAFLLLTVCGCQSTDGPRPVTWLLNSMTQSRCVARTLKPGTRYVNSEGQWIEVGENGEAHPIKEPN